MAKRLIAALILALVVIFYVKHVQERMQLPPVAEDQQKHPAHPKAEAPAATLKIKFSGTPRVDQDNAISLIVSRVADGEPVALSDLQETNTRKMHLLLIDPALEDFHHLHPEPTNEPGVYTLLFHPHREGLYRAWLDVTPVATGRQEYTVADIGAAAVQTPTIDKTENHKVTLEEYTYTLSFEAPPEAGKPAAARVTVTDTESGMPVTSLEPVLGAFAHVTAFHEDYKTLLHAHPMGEESISDESRGGGPDLVFHLEPSAPGFIKLFVQTRIGGKDYFAPFGVTVK